ncbi:ECF transporter S component [Sporosarcina sp. FSL K6-1522]|uniref:ECF transporter S component n=1 Tax=Sporosarcina sp. FSL K6-1522 TaxID=2921554 RepID=UPI00315AF166
MKLQRLTLTALFAAMCVIGGMIKIPSAMGSLALDTVPALLSVAFLPPLFSGIAATLGHVASAMYAGFPMGPFHVLVALEMFAIVVIFSYLHKAGYTLMKWGFFILANGLLAPLPFYFLVSPAFFVGILPSILVATLLNSAVAAVVIPALQQVAKGRMGALR